MDEQTGANKPCEEEDEDREFSSPICYRSEDLETLREKEKLPGQVNHPEPPMSKPQKGRD